MRKKLINDIVQRIRAMQLPHPIRVGFDGIPAAGKTTLAAEVAGELERHNARVIRSTIDGFHNPPEIRRRQGPMCPNGYYEDSFNFAAIEECVLQPLGPQGDLNYKAAHYDYRIESEINCPIEAAPKDAVLIFDGVFLQRQEIDHHWDLKVYVDISFDESLRRATTRDADFFGDVEEVKRKHHGRYIPGQQRYLEEREPHTRAHIVIDNENPSSPGWTWNEQ